MRASHKGVSGSSTNTLVPDTPTQRHKHPRQNTVGLPSVTCSSPDTSSSSYSSSSSSSSSQSSSSSSFVSSLSSLSSSTPSLSATTLASSTAQQPHVNDNNDAQTRRQHIRVTALNCGRSGLAGTAIACARYAQQTQSDVLAISEAHIRTGTAPTMPEFDVLFLPRSHHVPFRNLGGVAVAVRQHSPHILAATVVEVCPMADMLCVRLTLLGCLRYMYVIAVYLPPTGRQYECECASTACPKCHIAPALAWLTAMVQQCTTDGDVIVTGDFNANMQLDSDSRCIALTQHLLQGPHPPLALLHPHDDDGKLIGTRQSDHGGYSVLDLCLLSSRLLLHCIVTVSDGAVIADHCALHATYTFSDADGADDTPVYDDNVVWPPKYLTRMHRMHEQVSLPHHQLQLQACVAASMPALRQLQQQHGDVFKLAHMLEDVVSSALLGVQRNLGLVRTVRGVPTPALPPDVQLQRQKERLRRKLHRLHGSSQHAQTCELLSAELNDVMQQQRLVRSQQRLLHRQWQSQVKRQRQDVLDHLWASNNSRTLASERRVLLTSHLAVAKRPPRAGQDTARIERDVWEWHRYLQDKYAPGYRTDMPAVNVYDTQRLQLRQQCHGVVCDVPVTVDEVQRAVKLLHAQSAAIGVPTAVIKLLTSHDFVHTLVFIIQRMLDGDGVPDFYCIVRAVVLHKKGDKGNKSNYRIIGVGPAISRVIQLVALNRLLQYATSDVAISVNQHGFVFGRSTEQCVFSVLSAAACATERGDKAVGVFLDIASAFASTPHALILYRLRQLGVPRYLWRFMDSWLTQQRMFVQIGRHASPLFPVNIGVVEGGPASPLQFVLVLNTLPARLDTHIGTPGCGLTVPGAGALVHKWFADDGTVWGTGDVNVQPLLDACAEEASGIGMIFNVGPAKTAAVCLRPTGKYQRTRVNRQLQQFPLQLHLGDDSVPFTLAYKYLGVWVHSNGYFASVKYHVQQLQSVCGTILRQALTCGLRSISLHHGLSLYLQFWKPRLSYCLGFYAATVDLRLQHVEEVVLKVMCAAPNMPVCVLRSIAGVPSFHCVLQQAQLGLLWRVLLSPPGDIQRHILGEMVRLCDNKQAKTLWWYRVTATLRDMDCMCAAGSAVDAHGVQGGGASWYSSVHALALRPSDDIVRDVNALCKLYKRVLLAAEQQRRDMEIQRCASLREVEELLVSPNFAPFIVEGRTKACQLRVMLRGGVRQLFDARFRHVDVCPWCRQDGGFTVAHILRDCPNLEQERMQCWQLALQYGVQQGVMTMHDITQQRHHWYLLTVGAAVPHTFCHMHLDNDTHWARGDGKSATKHLRQHRDTYITLLARTGSFLVSVVHQTAEQLAAESQQLHRRAPAHARRTIAFRWTPQQLAKARSAQVQPQQPQAPVPAP